MWEELENSLAWFRSAPANWVQSRRQDLAAAAQWIWEVLQGDFNDDPSTAQTVTGTVISMIPFVDQICDVRDVVANCKKINDDSTNKWAWVALVLTLIGLFPTLGSLAKGCFKILFAYGRKGVFSVGNAALDAGFWRATQPYVEAGVQKLNDFLARPAVRRSLRALRWDNPYRELATQARALAGRINVSAVTARFDEVIEALTQLTDLIQRWGTAAMGTQAGQLVSMVRGIRNQANSRLGEVIAPVQDWVNRLARRLDIEADNSYRAATNRLTPHRGPPMALDAEVVELRRATPDWVRVGRSGPFAALEEPPRIPPGHFNIGVSARGPLREIYATFHSARPDRLPPGTVLYRVVSPNNLDNSVHWMTRAEFAQLRGKTKWRDRFAVWRHWNVNGEYLTYTVPPGAGLAVWRGPAASQQLMDGAGRAVQANSAGSGFWLRGGAEQIAVNPADLSPAYASRRQATGWGYGEGEISVNLVGVPRLTNNWRNR